MKILFIKSSHIRIAGMALALDRLGHEIVEYSEAGEEIGENPEGESRFSAFLDKSENADLDFVISHIFAPVIAAQTNKRGLKYAVYGVDSPMYHTYLEKYPRLPNCYLFYFDHAEYMRMRQMGYTNAYYLPLAADIIWTENLQVTDEEIAKYQCDVSFVGGLYSNSLYDRGLHYFPADLQNTFSEMMENCAFYWDGQDRMTPFVTPQLMESMRRYCPRIFNDMYDMPAEFYMKHQFFYRKLTNIERTLLLQTLAEQYDLRLYTGPEEEVPEGIRRFPPVDYLSDAFKVFYSSKINLNITLRCIESGVPLRIFDIMSVGGFVLSNYQQEMTELFEEDKEIVLFRTPEEMLEKADYYLHHDKERIRIGINGYKKVKECYSYGCQMQKLIAILKER
ncbi:MAG: glycosyltransferase [Ruminococcus sp.]|nr:glycosyltransferase [Ruminococcus sp.]